MLGATLSGIAYNVSLGRILRVHWGFVQGRSFCGKIENWGKGLGDVRRVVCIVGGL